MKVTRGYSDETVRPYPVGTIGNFDGHHIGHHTLLKQVVDSARRAQGTAVVLTFDPHPAKILAPHVDLRFLTDKEEKLARFERAGIDEVVFLEFTETFAALSPEEFAERILSKGLGLKEIFVGQHFAFGHKRAGKISDLIALGERFDFLVHPMPPVTIDGGVVSSTRIRQLVIKGQVDQAAVLLGRQYALNGVVSTGEGRGRTLGWPTANLRLPSERVAPADGIYASITIIDQERHDSVAYIGTRPTFDGGERRLEVSILDGTHELYGRLLTVEFIGRIRGDVRFDGEDALSRQIASDTESARSMLRRHHLTIGGR
ncbi:MAG: bifunctional riboflavin kinase/FAD synthetase [Nitrospira sp. BO4]|jgi:riboflavin kinase/FMN adenylyltransferase|nr:bifunctional riboflavin kinase/FAD synthetase [Nitrospira sp. BO4]